MILCARIFFCDVLYKSEKANFGVVNLTTTKQVRLNESLFECAAYCLQFLFWLIFSRLTTHKNGTIWMS